MILKRYVTVLVFIVAHVAVWMNSTPTAAAAAAADLKVPAVVQPDQYS